MYYYVSSQFFSTIYIIYSISSFVVDCLWNEWQIGVCDKSCGGGSRTDTRERKVDVEHGGQECTGDSTLTESCNVHECPGKLVVNMMHYN